LTLPNGKPTDDAVLHAQAHSMARAMDGDPWPPEDDHDTYFADHDQVIECEAIDAEAGEPETWGDWTDAYRYEPTPNDIAFLNRNAYGSEPFEPSGADLDEMAAWSEHLDRLESLRIEDDHQAEVRARFG
jgi:hypothetical protein